VPERGGPTDGGLLDGALTKAKRSGMQVYSVYADRGLGTSTGDAALARHRIRDPVIPRQQRAGPREQSRSSRRRYRFGNGLEGRISQLKPRGCAAHAYELSKARRPGSAASSRATTCNGWRCSPERAKAEADQAGSGTATSDARPARARPFFRGK
jgi:hypothetical protein